MPTRRQTLQHGVAAVGVVASAGLVPSQAFAWNKAAFDSKTIPDAVKAFGATSLTQSSAVTVTGPEIAENGAVVPLGAATTLPGVRQLLILVEKNPNAPVALFNVSDAVEPNFAIRAKMSQTSDVYAVAITGDGKAHFARKEVKVTLGGCGV